MKKLIAALLLALPVFGYAESQTIGGQWRGLHNADSSVVIDDNEAQSIQDVDITDGGTSIRKRPGYSLSQSVGSSTIGVRGGYYFRDINGNDVVVHANLNSIYKSVNSATYSAFVTTDTSGSYYDFTDSQGYLWRANSNRDQIVRYDGTTKLYYPNSPKGNQIEATPTRLVISGTSSNPNRINFSAEADFTDFATGILDSSAFFEDVFLPGQSVNAIKSACGGVLAWTKDSLSLVTAQTQFDLNPTIQVSNTIGTFQPDTVVNDLGVVYWQGQDNHFYAYDCNSITKISSKLDVSGIVSGTSREWLTDTQANFQTGTIGAGLSATSSPGDIKFSPSLVGDPFASLAPVIDGFTDGDYTSSPAWTVSYSTNAPFSVVGGTLHLSTQTGTTNGNMIYTSSIISTGTWNITAKLGSGTMLGNFFMKLCSSVPTKVTSPGYEAGCYTARFLPTEIDILNGTSLVSSVVPSGTPLTTLARVFSFERNSSGNLKIYIDGVLQVSGTNTAINNAAYFAIGSYGIDQGGIVFDNYAIDYHSAIYQSQAYNIGTAISSWGPFTVNNVLNSGTITYGVYVDTNSSIDVTNSATFTSSQTITSGSVPSVSVGPYITWTAQFDRTLNTQDPTLNDVTVDWNEGTITRHSGTIDKNHRLIWSVAEGTATVPNVSYIFDPRFGTWLKYNFPMSAPAKVGDSIYFGDVNQGKVYIWPSGNTDAGSAITAFWKSKDFISPDPFVEKNFFHYSLLAKSQTGSNLDITYTINGAASGILSNFSLTESNGLAYKRINQLLPNGKFGSFINWKFGNDDGDSPFEIYAFGYDATVKPWRVFP